MSTGFARFCAVSAFGMTALAAHAEKNIEERLAADPRCNVEISNVAGSIELKGWERAEVEVTGTVGNDVEAVSVAGDAAHVTVKVITRQNRLWGSEDSARLVVRVPARSAVSATLVSANFAVSGLDGDLNLHSVSGDVSGDVGGDLRAGSVSGNIDLTARSAKSIAVKTVSGDITLTGGSGETELTTVSGTIKVHEGPQSRAHIRSVSGDVHASLGLTGSAQIDGESVSGDIDLEFSTMPAADFDIQTLSGDIANCFGPKPVEPANGHGSRLTFKSGNGDARVQISTKSGDVRLCNARAGS